MIDWGRVQILYEEVGAEDFEEIVDLFLDEVEEALAALSNHRDQNTLAEGLHFLKGSAQNLGFVDFSDLCAQGEKTAESGGATFLETEPIIAKYAASKVCFLDGLPRLKAA